MVSDIAILKAVCRRRGLLTWDVRGPSRLRELMAARKEIAARCRAEGYTYREIARLLWRRDHTAAFWWARGGRGKQRRTP